MSRKPKKCLFLKFFLSPGGEIIILHLNKAAFFAAGIMAHQNLKRNWGITILVSELPRLELAERGKNGIFFQTSLSCSYETVWIQTCCPLYYQGKYVLQLYGLYTHVHRDSSWFWDVIICHKPKKCHFFHFCLSPEGGIIILQPPKAAFVAAGTMAHQNLKRNWGSLCLFLSCWGSNLQNGRKMGFLEQIPTITPIIAQQIH